VAGTVHDADTPQLPQSMSPVDAVVWQLGCVTLKRIVAPLLTLIDVA
jgi:hypothetical protein